MYPWHQPLLSTEQNLGIGINDHNMGLLNTDNVKDNCFGGRIFWTLREKFLVAFKIDPYPANFPLYPSNVFQGASFCSSIICLEGGWTAHMAIVPRSPAAYLAAVNCYWGTFPHKKGWGIAVPSHKGLAYELRTKFGTWRRDILK